MPFYLTGNPVPSASVLDIRDNSQNLDLALNDITSSLWADRLGRNRMTWYGMESAFTVKLSDFELRFISQITEQETAFDVAQADKESRFTTQLDGQDARFDAFIASSGYDIIGDYTVGTIPEGNPLAITEYNQLIRYNNELYKLTAATDIPFTASGKTDETWTTTDSAHFVSVGDAALRQNLGSSELPGTGIVSLKYSGTVADALVDIYVDALGDFKNRQDGCTEAILEAVEHWGGRTDSAYVDGQKNTDAFIFQMVPMH
nr:Uncharacterised protein [Raoultella sp. NCTC 9187]